MDWGTVITIASVGYFIAKELGKIRVEITEIKGTLQNKEDRGHAANVLAAHEAKYHGQDRRKSNA